MLDWRGDEVVAKVIAAATKATAETVDEAIEIARPLTPVRTGETARSLSRENDGLEVSWGYHVVDEQGRDRGIWVEIGANGRAGAHALRRAADSSYGRLPGNIRRRLR